MKKSIGKLALSLLTIVITATTTLAESPFQDIDQSFAKQDIINLAEKGVVGGFSDGTFRPESMVTRAEFATMLVKAKGIPAPTTYEGVFRDVQRGEWYAPFAELSYRLGVTSGSDGLFFPDRYLTREEMMKMTVSALGRESETARKLNFDTYSRAISPFTDRGQISKWAVKSVAYAVQQDLITGTPEGKILPKVNATRAEVATFLNRSIVSRPQITAATGAGLVAPVSRGGGVGFPYVAKKTAEATAYVHSGNLSAIGLKTREGLVAVDPTYIPLGSHLFIPGYGYGIAGDTGGKIKSGRVDLFMRSYDAAIQFGRRDVDIYVLD